MKGEDVDKTTLEFLKNIKNIRLIITLTKDQNYEIVNQLIKEAPNFEGLLLIGYKDEESCINNQQIYEIHDDVFQDSKVCAFILSKKVWFQNTEVCLGDLVICEKFLKRISTAKRSTAKSTCHAVFETIN